MSGMLKSELNDEEKRFCAVALSKIQATQSLLMPITTKSPIITNVQQHLSEVSVLLALVIYQRPEVSSRA